ncbi:MAG: lipid-A-disaccharide synthase [Phycisphaerae bacterium]|nr:lipid-A-disaccharide synthase [Phycisphaerae bacterium]
MGEQTRGGIQVPPLPFPAVASGFRPGGIAVQYPAMHEPDRTYRVFISAVEPSADVHCAALITALTRRHPGVRFAGIGGDKMAAAGCPLIDRTTDRGAMGLNGLREVGYFLGLLKRIKRSLQSDRPDLVVVCDSPSFNFHVAKAARRAGIRTAFYVAPQLWAWAGWRIGKLRRTCDRLCCVLPFEEQWFKTRGVEATFVGNPLVERLGDLSGNAKTYADLDRRPLRIGLMPGSRTAEIRGLWRPMQQIALRLRADHPRAQFAAVAVNDLRRKQLQADQVPGFECEYSIDSVYRTSTQVDFSLVASGSATLEVAAAGCPMVVMYRAGRIAWNLVGRWITTAPFFSLVNLIAGRELVREFVPHFTSIDPIVDHATRLLADRAGLDRLSRDLVALTQPLAGKRASEEVAGILLGMMSEGGEG